MNAKRKLNDASTNEFNKKIKPSSGSDEKCSETPLSSTNDFFKGLSAYILQPGIEKARIILFKKQIVQNGGTVEESFSASKVSHIVVDDKMEVDRMLRLLKLEDFPEVTVVKTLWLSTCLKNKKLIEPGDYQLKQKVTRPKLEISSDVSQLSKESQYSENILDASNLLGNGSSKPMVDIKSSTIPLRNPQLDYKANSDSDYEASDNESKGEEMDVVAFSGQPRKNIPVDKWICAQSSKNPKQNYNKHITDKLEEMVKAYDSTNDKWRSYGYQKCIRALERHPKSISSWEEAKSLPGVGGRLADKIWEIAQSGELRKLNEFKSSEEIRTLELFNNVWGAGPHTSHLWYQQGFRSIDDLRTKAKLTSQQKVGVRLYDELLERMSRDEAGRIADVVREAAESIQPGIIAQACGSYRRGKPTCGDVDVLVTHPDGKSHKGVFGKLLDKLHETGFLTDDLVSSEDNGNQRKYLGVCKLPGNDTKHRRLDIIVVPYNEYACAVVYFTGSAHFNRSLRLLCKRQDMSLSEHALRCGVVRQGGERVHEGSIIPTPTEESLFTIMKIPFRPPEERDH